MILDFFDKNALSAEEWEELCDACYAIRYKEIWHKVPSDYLGDAGIEGYVETGIVYQCYCPEQPYANDELYKHQRDKLTKDIGKFRNPEYIKKLKKIFGDMKVKRWSLVVPEYKDRKILEHAQTKQQEILADLKKDPSVYPHIDEDFKITVVQAKDFVEELSCIIRAKNNKIKLPKNEGVIDYSKCEVDKVENIKRKLSAIYPNISEEKLNDLINKYIEFYLRGVARLTKLTRELPLIYSQLFELLEVYKERAELTTHYNADKTMNKTVFDDIMKEFKQELEKMNIFDQASIMSLNIEIISGWLADCSMEFVP